MKKKQLFDLIWNIVLIGTILWAVAWYYVPGHVDAIGSTGLQSFRYFTTDSNLLIALSSFLWILYETRILLGKDVIIPSWLRILRYASAAAGALTFLEVLLFMFPMAIVLGGIKGALRCYEENVFVLHFSAPLMMALSFLWTDRNYQPAKRDRFLAMIPMIIYSLVYFVMVVVIRNWPDFYRFTFGRKYYLSPIVMIIMFSASYGIALGMVKLKEFFNRKQNSHILADM